MGVFLSGGGESAGTKGSAPGALRALIVATRGVRKTPYQEHTEGKQKINRHGHFPRKSAALKSLGDTESAVSISTRKRKKMREPRRLNGVITLS